MGKFLPFFLLCFSNSAFPQFQFGTLIAFHIAEGKLTVAADSRQAAFNHGQPTDTKCKIVVFNHQFVFASSAFDIALGADSEPAWSNAEAAREAYIASKGAPEQRFAMMANSWSKTMVSRWSDYYQKAPSFVMAAANHDNGLLVDGFFAGFSDGDFLYTLRAVVLKDGKIVTYPGDPTCRGDFCAFGSTDIFNEFLIGETPRAKLQIDQWNSIPPTLRNPDQSWKLSALIKLTEDLDPKHSVGGEVDEVQIDQGGVHWISRKPGCLENYD